MIPSWAEPFVKEGWEFREKDGINHFYPVVVKLLKNGDQAEVFGDGSARMGSGIMNWTYQSSPSCPKALSLANKYAEENGGWR